MAAITYKLYAKGGPGNNVLGDCPFTQRANMAFEIKGVHPELIFIDLKNKPDYFLTINPSGTVPVLQAGDTVIADSAAIVDFVDETFPEPSLKPEGWKEAVDVSGNIFNTFSAFAKNKDASQTEELKRVFIEEVKKINDYLSKRKGPLFFEQQWTVADCMLAPRLYHIKAVSEHYLKFDPFSDAGALTTYMEYVFSSKVFKATGYPVEFIYGGWAKYFN